MIHSLSGGVIDGGEIRTFAKVQTEDGARWYLVPELTTVNLGDRVVVPNGLSQAEGIVVKVEHAGKQTAPVPFNRAKEILSKKS